MNRSEALEGDTYSLDFIVGAGSTDNAGHGTSVCHICAPIPMWSCLNAPESGMPMWVIITIEKGLLCDHNRLYGAGYKSYQRYGKCVPSFMRSALQQSYVWWRVYDDT